MRKKGFIEILKLTEKMQSAADQLDWMEVVSLENQRNSLLYQFFETQASKNESNWIRDGINRILIVDKSIAEKAKQEQSSLTQQLHLVSSRKKVSDAYKTDVK